MSVLVTVMAYRGCESSSMVYLALGFRLCPLVDIWTVSLFFFFFSSRRLHTRSDRDWSSDVCSSDLGDLRRGRGEAPERTGDEQSEDAGHEPDEREERGEQQSGGAPQPANPAQCLRQRVLGQDRKSVV